MKPPPVLWREASEHRRHISQELAPSPFGRLPGLHWASPSTPLDVSSYVGGSIAAETAAPGVVGTRASADAGRAAKSPCRTCPVSAGVLAARSSARLSSP